MEKEYDVFGVGNPLMDISLKVEDGHLVSLGLDKGVMHLVDSDKSGEILKQIAGKDVKMCPAGACANTMMGVAKLGGRAVMCGKLGRDRYADFYEAEVKKDGVVANFVRCSEGGKTGSCVSFVTPDAERTFATHLGAALTLQKDEIVSVFDSELVKSKVFYVTAYLLEADNLKETVLHAFKVARDNGVKVAVDLADPALIERNLSVLKDIVKEHVDILFVNETEAKAFTGLGAEEAAIKLGEYADIAVVKIGEKGSIINHNGAISYVNADVVKAVDTTGAGDLYAAGFLYGFTQGKDIAECGRLGSEISAKIVQQMGARFE